METQAEQLTGLYKSPFMWVRWSGECSKARSCILFTDTRNKDGSMCTKQQLKDSD